MFSSRFAVAAAAATAFSAPAEAQAPGPTIIVWSFGFYPRPIVLATGRRVTLTFQNRSGSSHDFTAKTFFAASRILHGDAANGEVELRPYETKSVTLIPQPGRYGAHCSHFFHKQLGMSNQIYVY